MEALQMLKFMLKKEQLNFMKDWKTPVSDMAVDPDNENDTLQDILSVPPLEMDEALEQSHSLSQLEVQVKS
ncbi:hypothetical protein BS47DRAFT_1399676 [Hydnum rufescens UP504]|uniref:Uncharacterized protein n=1 Tax=Hydnum rufescens UP504 TaxID=1448309 RepID=A0A9P6AJ12_9AGAM|nr:hypothetical protein BS47DRAFT_1399676 [Hydnum rufescens UP504]